jgi:flagellar FliL protein
MSAAAAAAEAPPPAKGKKKLILILAIVGVLVAGGGGAAVFMMKKKAAAEAEADGEEGGAAAHAAPKAAKHDPKAVPAFVPLDPFTVNLADREAERYAQIGVTLELEDPHVADQIKNYMPAIRNNILMAMADRTAGDLMGRDGKAKLAEKIRRETSKALGVEVDDEDEAAAEDDGHDKPAAKGDAKAKSKKKKKKAAPTLPIKAVHFSNFIIQ